MEHEHDTGRGIITIPTSTKRILVRPAFTASGLTFSLSLDDSSTDSSCAVPLSEAGLPNGLNWLTAKLQALLGGDLEEAELFESEVREQLLDGAP